MSDEDEDKDNVVLSLVVDVNGRSIANDIINALETEKNAIRFIQIFDEEYGDWEFTLALADYFEKQRTAYESEDGDEDRSSDED